MSDWQSYTGKYDKVEYLIRTKEGRIIGPCWPNAGYFHPLDGSERIDGEDVSEILIADPLRAPKT